MPFTFVNGGIEGLPQRQKALPVNNLRRRHLK